MITLRFTFFSLVAIGGLSLAIAPAARAADDYAPPPQAERDAVAALKAKGAILQVDGNYRVSHAIITGNCTNDDLKLLAACERLTGLQLMSARITDEGLDDLKALSKLTSIMVSSGVLSDAAIEKLRGALPNCRITNVRTTRPAAGGAAPGSSAATVGPAQEVATRFISSGITARMGGYVPIRAEMNGTADSVTKAPDGLEAPKYGKLKLGSQSWTFILDEPEDKPAKLYVDANADGDLTNDAATAWSARKFNNLNQYSGSARVDLGGGKLGTVNLYRFDPSDAQRAALKNTMMFYPDFGYELTLTLDDKKFTTTVSAEPGLMPIWIDRDGNKQRSNKREMIRVGAPFNFTGTTYVLNRAGSEYKLQQASASLPVAPLPPDLSVGKPALPFQMATLDGSKIDFPKSYSGKLVMLDFWATWCGPCIAELPNVKKAYADWHDKGFEILGISFDNPNMEDKVKTFLKDHELPWPQIYEGKGWTTTLGEQYEVTAIPFVLLVDGDSGEILATVSSLRGPGLSDFIGTQLAKKGNAAAITGRSTSSGQGK